MDKLIEKLRDLDAIVSNMPETDNQTATVAAALSGVIGVLIDFIKLEREK
jgi:hypothetical protein